MIRAGSLSVGRAGLAMRSELKLAPVLRSWQIIADRLIARRHSASSGGDAWHQAASRVAILSGCRGPLELSDPPIMAALDHCSCPNFSPI